MVNQKVKIVENSRKGGKSLEDVKSQMAGIINKVKASDIDAITTETKQAMQSLKTKEENKKGEEKDGKD